jgi:OPA family glycerol-3-phosphate transporter-like MFS transporter
MPMLADELKHTTGMTGNEAIVRLGGIVSLGVLVYAAGKFLLAGLGDFWGGRWSFLGGLSGAVLFTVLFTLGGGLPIFTIAWLGNRLIQSMGWAGLVKVCSQWFSFTAYGSIVAILSLSFLIGDALAREWMGLLIEHGYGWRSLFYLAAIVAGIALAANFIFLRGNRTQLGFPEPEANPLNVFENQPASGNFLTPFLKSPAFWIVCFLSLCTTIVRETFNRFVCRNDSRHRWIVFHDDAAFGCAGSAACGADWHSGPGAAGSLLLSGRRDGTGYWRQKRRCDFFRIH